MMLKRVYQGKVEWHTDKPTKSGVYLVSDNGWVGEYKFNKTTGKWTSYDESENGGFITFDNVNAWAYLPEPYCNKN